MKERVAISCTVVVPTLTEAQRAAVDMSMLFTELVLKGYDISMEVKTLEQEMLDPT